MRPSLRRQREDGEAVSVPRLTSLSEATVTTPMSAGERGSRYRGSELVWRTAPNRWVERETASLAPDVSGSCLRRRPKQHLARPARLAGHRDRLLRGGDPQGAHPRRGRRRADADRRLAMRGRNRYPAASQIRSARGTTVPGCARARTGRPGRRARPADPGRGATSALSGRRGTERRGDLDRGCRHPQVPRPGGSTPLLPTDGALVFRGCKRFRQLHIEDMPHPARREGSRQTPLLGRGVCHEVDRVAAMSADTTISSPPARSIRERCPRYARRQDGPRTAAYYALARRVG